MKRSSNESVSDRWVDVLSTSKTTTTNTTTTVAAVVVVSVVAVHRILCIHTRRRVNDLSSSAFVHLDG